MKSAILSKKGWVVIPQDLRERYHLKQGDRVQIIDYGDVISIIPLSQPSITHALGWLKGSTSLTQELVKSREQDAEARK